MSQQGDVLLFQTNDDGDISVVNGTVEMSGGLRTSAYISLFGGNENDSGSAQNNLQFWGNFVELELEKKYRSETQFLLRSLPAIPANLLRLEDAAKRDLAWMVTVGAASEVTATASMPGLNTVRLIINVIAIGSEESFEFIENWKAEK